MTNRAMFQNFAVDHIGIAVTDINAMIKHYEAAFGFNLIHKEILEERGIELAFLSTGNTKIELLMGIKEGNVISKYIERRGQGLHHICYVVEDIEKELSKLESTGFELIDKQARPGAMNTLVAFIHPKSCGGVLTELCQEIS